MDELLPGARRSRVEFADGVEQLVIRYPRSWVLGIFFTVWMVLWTAGTAAGFYAMTLGFEPSLAIFLAFLIATWLLVAAVASWQLAGEEIIRVEPDRLIHMVRAPGWQRRHFYPIGEIQELASDAGPRPYDRSSADNPPLSFGLSGVVKFQRGGKTVRMGKGQSEAEGKAILAWLIPRLPISAQTVSS